MQLCRSIAIPVSRSTYKLAMAFRYTQLIEVFLLFNCALIRILCLRLLHGSEFDKFIALFETVVPERFVKIMRKNSATVYRGCCTSRHCLCRREISPLQKSRLLMQCRSRPWLVLLNWPNVRDIRDGSVTSSFIYLYIFIYIYIFIFYSSKQTA